MDTGIKWRGLSIGCFEIDIETPGEDGYFRLIMTGKAIVLARETRGHCTG